MRTIATLILFGSLILYWFPFAYAQKNGLLGTEKKIEFYGYQIIINQYKRTSRPTRIPHICSAIITISTKGRVIEKFEYQDIDAVGWRYGIFFPKHQESKDHFVLFKYGDYDSRTIIISRDGKIFNLGGGDYKIFNGKFLITTHHEDDITGFTIVDLSRNEILITTDDSERFAGIYKSDNKFYVKMQTFIKQNNERWKETTLHYQLEIEAGKLIQIDSNPNIFSTANLIKIDLSNIDFTNDCECK